MNIKSKPVRIGVIGFGPFDHHDHNPSGEIAESLHGYNILGVEILGLSIPVSWEMSGKLVRKLKVENQIEAIIALGVSDDSYIRLESTAKNYLGMEKDIKGLMPSERVIAKTGPQSYKSTLPIFWLKKEIDKLISIEKQVQATTFPLLETQVSHNAGDYLCNYLFYLLIHDLQRNIPYIGFIHLPPLHKLSTKDSYQYRVIKRSVIQIITLFIYWLMSGRINRLA